MSRLREFQRSTVSLEKSVFEDMLVRLEKMEALEKKIQSLELELLQRSEKEKIKEDNLLVFFTRSDFEEEGRQQGILVLEKHWSEFKFYTENHPLAYSMAKTQWLEDWWEYEWKREEEYQRELRVMELEKEKETEKEMQAEEQKNEDIQESQESQEIQSVIRDDLVENNTTETRTGQETEEF